MKLTRPQGRGSPELPTDTPDREQRRLPGLTTKASGRPRALAIRGAADVEPSSDRAASQPHHLGLTHHRHKIAGLSLGILVAMLSAVSPQAAQGAPGDPATTCNMSVDVTLSPSLDIPLILDWNQVNRSGTFTANGTGNCNSVNATGAPTSQVSLSWSGSYQADGDKCISSGLDLSGPVTIDENGQPYLDQGGGDLSIPAVKQSSGTLTLTDSGSDTVEPPTTTSAVSVASGTDFCSVDGVSGFTFGGQVTLPVSLIGGGEDTAVTASDTAGAAADPVTNPLIDATQPVSAPVLDKAYTSVLAPAQDTVNTAADTADQAHDSLQGVSPTLYEATRAKRKRRTYDFWCDAGRICEIFPACHCQTSYQYGQFAAPFFRTKGADDYHQVLACEMSKEVDGDYWDKVTYGTHRCSVGFSPKQKNFTAVRNQNGAPPSGDGISGASWWCTRTTSRC